jgi:transposase-like protein
MTLLRLRGVILNAALTCPVCGGETMRVKRPRGLRLVLDLLHLRYRLCRHCMRTWVAAR